MQTPDAVRGLHRLDFDHVGQRPRQRQQQLQPPRTAWSLAHRELHSGSMDAKVHRLDQLLRPVLNTLELPQLSPDLLKRCCAGSRVGRGGGGGRIVKHRLSNRVDSLLKQVRRLQNDLFVLRRDFSLDENYCSWADSKRRQGTRSAFATGGAKGNVYLDVILSQYRRRRNDSDADRGWRREQQQTDSKRRDSSGAQLVVPLKRVRGRLSFFARPTCASLLVGPSVGWV